LMAAGLVHGMWAGRWSAGENRAVAAARLTAVPKTIGDWDATDRELSEREREVAGIDGYLLRRDVKRETGNFVAVVLVCGKPGPVSVHTPEVCYGGAGYAPTADPVLIDINLADSRTEQFRTALFRKRGEGAIDQLRIFWSWHAGTAWQAPDSPRWAFA